MPTESESTFVKQNTADVKRSSWLTGFFTGFARGRNESSTQQAVSLSEQIAEAAEGESRKSSVSEESPLKSFLKQNSTGEGSSHSDCESLSEDLDKVSSSSPINVNTGGIRRNKTFPYLSQFTFHDNELAGNDNLSELTTKSNYNANRGKDKMERSMSFDAANQEAGFSSHRRRLPSESSILGSLTGRGALFPSDSVDRQNEDTSEAFDTSEIVHFLSSGRSY